MRGAAHAARQRPGQLGQGHAASAHGVQSVEDFAKSLRACAATLISDELLQDPEEAHAENKRLDCTLQVLLGRLCFRARARTNLSLSARHHLPLRPARTRVLTHPCCQVIHSLGSKKKCREGDFCPAGIAPVRVHVYVHDVSNSSQKFMIHCLKHPPHEDAVRAGR